MTLIYYYRFFWLITLQYAAALAMLSLISGVAGCQSGGPRDDNKPMEIGEAFTTPTPFSCKASHIVIRSLIFYGGHTEPDWHYNNNKKWKEKKEKEK